MIGRAFDRYRCGTCQPGCLNSHWQGYQPILTCTRRQSATTWGMGRSPNAYAWDVLLLMPNHRAARTCDRRSDRRAARYSSLSMEIGWSGMR